MKRSNRLVLLIGIFLAVVAFVGIALTLSGPGGGQTAVTPPANVATVIAARDIALGVRVTPDMITEQELPVSQRNPGSFEDVTQVVGQIARRPITEGAQITDRDFSASGAVNEIVVPAGQRAVAVQVDQVSGVGTLIKTGDYVDMVVGLSADAFPVVTINPDDETITVVAGLNSTSVKLLIEGMQVIGTLLPPPVAQAQPQGGASPAADPGTNLQEGQQEIVILSVTAQQAEVIKFAQMDGDISLALRSAADFVDEEGNPIVVLPAGTTGVVLRTLVDSYGVLRPELVEAILPAQ